MGDTVVQELTAQFERQWKTVRDLIEKVPDSHWRTGDTDYLVPARQIYHVMRAADIYSSLRSYEEHKPHRRFPLDWERVDVHQLPDRATTLRYINELEQGVRDWLSGLGDGGLLTEDSDYDWTGSTKLGRALYLLRHTQNHIGEINSELRRRGLPRGKW